MTDPITEALTVARRTGVMQPTFAGSSIVHAYPDGRVDKLPIPPDFPSPFNEPGRWGGLVP